MTTHRFVLGTAGHIDHGKTALVRTLTGVDTDRLKEEKARGITIELGFASLEGEGASVGLVDVPGHERFIRAMAAGAGGVDAVMLVVAADEGVMPQTREHLAVCSLLGVSAGFVALNKVDLVDDPEWLELVKADIIEATADSFLADPVIIPVSAQTGAGADEVRAAILRLAETLPERQSDGLFRLPMDRVFTMHGFGTVVTGTLIAGQVAVGDDVQAAPADVVGKVRGIQVHGEETEEAVAGQRTAINIKGPDRDELARGLVLVKPGSLTATRRFDAQLRLLDWLDHPIKRGQRYIVLSGTTQAQGKINPLESKAVEPGETAWVQVDLDRPLMLLPGDRFVLQGFALSRDHGSTIGGGLVLRSHPPRRRKLDEAYAAFLGELAAADPEGRVAMEIEAAGVAGLTVLALAERVPYSPGETGRLAARLVKAKIIRRYDREPDAYVHRGPFDELGGRALQVITELAEASPMAEAFGRQEILSRLGGRIPPRVVKLVVDRLVQQGKLEGNAEAVAPPGSAERQALRELAEKLRLRIEGAGYEPPKAPALAAELGVDERDVRDLLASLIKAGRLVRAKDKFVFGAEVVAGLQEQLVAYLTEHGEIEPAGFKVLTGVTRKYLIPLAELFDERKVTLRVGNIRKLRR